MRLLCHPLKLVILDVDGVIVDLMAGFASYLEAAARQLHLPPEPIRHYLAEVHRGARQSYTHLAEAIEAWWPALPVPREHAVYVGDWYPDVEAAHGGGMRFIAVLSGGIPRHAFLREGIPEDHVIERLQHLLGLIEAP
jgi:phosphoglycolate phosphatase-like HAD superfamily hydrolase